jgi:hypothetical protein
VGLYDLAFLDLDTRLASDLYDKDDWQQDRALVGSPGICGYNKGRGREGKCDAHMSYN